MPSDPAPAAGPEVFASNSEHSSALRKELTLFDLVLAQLLVVLVADYMGTAVKAGASHVVFWICGIFFFFLPLAAVVIHLNRLIPLEGGLYEWARIAFDAYAIPGAAWMATSKPMLIAASCTVIALTMFIAGLGLSAGKWVSNIASIAFLIAIA